MTDIQITPQYKDVKPQGFYVYLHRRATDGSVFYVGKGSGFRAWRWKGTISQHWRSTAHKNGVIVDIYMDGMSEDCAFTLEKIAIGIYGIGRLCNVSLGGDGVSGLTGDMHRSYNHTIYDFVNVDGRSFSGTQYCFQNDFNLSQPSVSCLVNGVRKSYLGWRLSDTDFMDTGTRGSNVWNYDTRVFTFYHNEKGEFTGTQRELINKYSLTQSNVNKMVNGDISHSYGWHLDKSRMRKSTKEGSNNPSYDSTVINFTNIDGAVFIGTAYEFRVKFGIDFRSVSGIVTGRNMTHKGWRHCIVGE